MPNIPGYCDNCNLWSPSPLHTGDNTPSFGVEGISTRCRRCRGIAPIPDGTYETVGGTVRLVKSLDLSESELLQLSNIIERAIENNTPAGKLREIIERESPKAAGLKKFITDGVNLAVVLGLILNTLGVLLALYTVLTTKQIDQEKVVEDVINRLTSPPKPPPVLSTSTPVNAPCPCGSGIKYKKCCASKDRQPTQRNARKKH